jgi:CubicO group peptidase (beta-lactamase class C family)
MKAWLNGMLAAACLLTAPAYAYQCGFDQAITDLLTDFIEANNIPGAAVSIKLPDHTVCNYAVGYADVAAKKPMVADSLFSVGSINKSFTGVALLQLEQTKKLKLSDTLAAVAQKKSPLSQLIKKYPNLAAIKIQELLNHTSGLPEIFTTKGYQTLFQKNPEDRADETKLLKLGLQGPWGEHGEFHYTNTDYILAGMVIEDVTQKPLAVTMNNLLSEANISGAYFPTNDKMLPPGNMLNFLAQGYLPENPHWPSAFKQALNRYPKMTSEFNPDAPVMYDVTKVDLAQLSVGAAASGMLMSTPDMIKWYEYLFLNKNSLMPVEREKLLAPLTANNNSSYGLGIVTNYLADYDFTVYTHSGSFFGYNTSLIYIKNNDVIMALAINAQRDKLRLRQDLTTSILDYLGGAGYFAEYAHKNPDNNQPETLLSSIAADIEHA